ncbi:MAG TPA: c-type cytochrome [Adhaeribacter sp.]|nr:c-type cytochrome [Adhaeribacter sp.]
MKNFAAICLLMLAAGGLSGCYYDVESELYPAPAGTACDTTNIGYQARIEPIIKSQCYACHAGTADAGGNKMLEGYANLKAVAETGRLYGAVAHQAGFSAMPKGGNKLPDCDIKAIKNWIDAGYPQ